MSFAAGPNGGAGPSRAGGPGAGAGARAGARRGSRRGRAGPVARGRVPVSLAPPGRLGGGGGGAGLWRDGQPCGQWEGSAVLVGPIDSEGRRARAAAAGADWGGAGRGRACRSLGGGAGVPVPFPARLTAPAPAPDPPRGRSVPFVRSGNAVRARGGSPTSSEGSGGPGSALQRTRRVCPGPRPL